MATPAEEFAEFFAEGWRRPKPDGFVAHFGPRMASDVRLAQPLAPDVHGVDGFEAFFRRLFSLMPDYLVSVDEWASREEGVVYLWVTHSATIGARRRSWHGVDRVRLSPAGQIEERVAYFDPLPQLPAFALAPKLWPGLARMLR